MIAILGALEGVSLLVKGNVTLVGINALVAAKILAKDNVYIHALERARLHVKHCRANLKKYEKRNLYT